MFSRIPPISNSDDCAANESVIADDGVDSRVPIDPVQRSDPDEPAFEATHCESTTDRDNSVVQMAFIQLMTQKVIEATANCPEILKQLNSNIRTDKE